MIAGVASPQTVPALSPGFTVDERVPIHVGRTPRVARGAPWAVVLAGGEGTRLRPFVRRLYGDDRPKQYAALISRRTLLRETLDRVALEIPAARTVVVTLASHARYAEEELGDTPGLHVLAQPSDRGTAAAILLATHFIAARDTEAVAVVFPSDHFIRDDRRFMTHVAEVIDSVNAFPNELILLGAPPMTAESDYGWVELGPRAGWLSRSPLYRVRRFVEKPPPPLARLLFAVGALASTFIFASQVGTLIDAGKEHLPALHERLGSVAAAVSAVDGARALRYAYAMIPAADFSRTILASSAVSTAVAKLPSDMWSDLGREERVLEVLVSRARRHPERALPPTA